MKAYLPLPEMPESCYDCILHRGRIFLAKCIYLNNDCADEGRREDCPIKQVEEGEKQNPSSAIYKGDSTDAEYCPYCGRKMD